MRLKQERAKLIAAAARWTDQEFEEAVSKEKLRQAKIKKAKAKAKELEALGIKGSKDFLISCAQD